MCFAPLFEETDGADGFVSIEVSPELARDTEGSIAEAYLRALEARIASGQRIDRLASVASMFVSRIDTEVDRRIQEAGGALAALQGRIAIANARLTYAAFLELTHSARWRTLAAQDARVQRPLWASTGTKNPNYSDVRYVESLIGAETISTIPPATLRAFEDHGTVECALSDDPGDAFEVMKTLAGEGIDFLEVNRTLEDEGIQKFNASLEDVLQALATKRLASMPAGE